MELHRIAVDAITVGARARSVNTDRVSTLAQSIKAIGLQTPISVWAVDDGSEVHLIAGAHRLAAAKTLGWEDIECVLVNMGEIDRRRWEIAENLHRSELTVLERDQHVAEWIRLTEEAEATTEKPAQSAPVSKGGRGKRAGINKASEELGIERTDAQRAVKVASLPEQAQETAREVGLDDNRTALLKAAKAHEEGKDASEVLRDIKAEAERKKAERKEAPAEVPAPEPQPPRAPEMAKGPFSEDEYEALLSLSWREVEMVCTKLHDLGWEAARKALAKLDQAA